MAIILLLLMGCSTEKNGILNKAYHNTTSRYNGYFNAKESVKEGAKSLVTGHKEDYTQILPVFIYGDDASARSVYPQMDKAIEKCTNVIQNHSMYIKKKEYCKWIDDSYNLMGKANFYKRDFKKAVEMLSYVEREYKESDIRFEARIWLAKTYIEAENYAKAISYLSLCKNDSEFPDKLKPELYQTFAHFYLHKKEYEKAPKALEKAIESTKKKKTKARLNFILAQVYQEQGNSSKALDYYTNTLDLNPEYEMAFYASINSAMAFDGGNSSVIKQKLLEMTKDEKYKEFYDQIYFALAELEFNENDKPKALEYYQLSYETSFSNDNQKAKTYNKLATIYYNDKNYIKAQAFYDSTVAVMDKTLPTYPDVLNIRNSLTRLVKDINTVSKEDSLQHLASLTKDEQLAIAEDIVAEIIEEEERKKQEEENNLLALQNGGGQTAQLPGGASGEWYFYNPTAISFGEQEFRKKWGNRKLEDNWRRKDKSSTDGGAGFDDFGDLEELDEADTTATVNDLKNPKYYLQNIPTTKKKKQKSNESIQDALYDMGIIYKEKLNNKPMAIQSFEELVTRFDSSQYHLNCYYQLYRLNLDENNTVKSDKYKQIILQDFPNSKYAQLIKDPAFLDKQKNQASEAEDYYKKTLSTYKSKYYAQALENCIYAETAFLESTIIHKFAYLKTLCVGETDSLGAFKTALHAFIATYGDTEEAKVAQRTLNLIEKPDAGESEEEGAGIEYTYKADSKHNFIVLLPATGIDLNKAKIAISDFNRKYYRSSNLKISSTLLGDKRMLIVKSFNNIFKGMDYYKSFAENEDLLKSITSTMETSFIITPENYPEFFKNTDIEGYQQFFDGNYK